MQNTLSINHFAHAVVDFVAIERALQQQTDNVKFLQDENKKCQAIIKEHENFRKIMEQAINDMQSQLSDENEKYQTIINEHENFRKIAGQTFHDLQSQFSSLRIIAESSNELPEEKRITLRSAVINAIDITANALHQYKPDANTMPDNNKRQAIMVATALSEIINDKRAKYKDHPIKFEYNLTKLNAFLCIKVAPIDFKRAISNLINNAVDALPKTGGKVELRLKSTEEWVDIIVLDDGAGMPLDVLNKIKSSIAVTAGKKDGHGIGFTQIRDMLENNNAKLDIFTSTSGINHGTTMSLRFPRIAALEWSTEQINLYSDDTVIILSNDDKVWSIWDKKFNYILEKIPSLVVKYFSNSNDVLEYAETLSTEARQRVCFICDYDLKESEVNGLGLIEATKIKRSMLITKPFADYAIKKTAVENLIKIIPQELLEVVSLNICQKAALADGKLANVHMVFLDDEKVTMNALVSEHYNHLIVDTYSNPFEFLDHVAKYSKDTKFILDNCYYAEDGSPYDIDGITIAQQLHEKGYTKLFLLSGEKFDIPDYLELILKADKEKIRNLDTL